MRYSALLPEVLQTLLDKFLSYIFFLKIFIIRGDG
jgi:hypothetical protein